MKLNQITLVNFQRHTNLTLDFVKGVNVIYGGSDCGKSTIVRALSWVFYNMPKGDVIRKEGTKKSSVILLFEDGTQLEKIKSSTVNAYVLTQNGQEKRFDSVGAKVPEEIKTFLTAYPIEVEKEDVILNISQQLGYPFLLDKPASFRMKFFNKITGNDLTDKLFSVFNKNVVNLNSQIKFTQERKDQLEQTILAKEPLCNAINEKLNSITLLYSEIKKIDENLEKHQSLLDKIQTNRDILKQIIISPIPQIDFAVLKQLDTRIQLLIDLKTKIEQNKSNLLNLKITPIQQIDFAKLKEQLQKLQQLIEWKNKKDKVNTDFMLYDAATQTNKVTEKELKEKIAELKSKIKICPTCQRILE